MKGVLLAALIWPVMLLAIGLIIGRVLRRGDRLAERRAPAAPAPEHAAPSGADDDMPLPLPSTPGRCRRRFRAQTPP